MRVSANFVIKKCEEAGVSFWTASETAVKMRDFEFAGERELVKEIGETLRGINVPEAEQFDSYHSIEVRTSKNVLEGFDKNRIADSLVKETGIPKTIAQDIAREVELDIRRLQLKNISAALIREMASTALLQKRLADAKLKYTRVGLPVYDIRGIIKRQNIASPEELDLFLGKKMLEEYTLMRVLPEDVSTAYLDSDIFIHDIEHFSSCPTAYSADFRTVLKQGFEIPGFVKTGPAKKADVAASHAVRLLKAGKRFSGRGTGIDSFNFLMAPY
ncbi:MAG: anaerobic ribonucleoside-triphosphate reductase, partial [Candidatus Micrarchaeota archaeon]